MKKISGILLAVCMLLSGCGTENGNRETEPVMGAGTEKTAGKVIEEPETETEPMVTICTGIDSEILERDDTFEAIDGLDMYLDSIEFTLVKLDCPAVYQMATCLYQEDEAKDWGEADWDFVVDDIESYDFSRDKLKGLEQDREVCAGRVGKRQIWKAFFHGQSLLLCGGNLQPFPCCKDLAGVFLFRRENG